MADIERRRFERLKRPFIVSYKLFGGKETGYDITQVKDLSIGGMRFITAQSYPPDTMLAIELKTPFKEERLKIKASVIESREVATNLIYDTRVRFVDLEDEERESLTKIINIFLKSFQERKRYED